MVKNKTLHKQWKLNAILSNELICSHCMMKKKTIKKCQFIVDLLGEFPLLANCWFHSDGTHICLLVNTTVFGLLLLCLMTSTLKCFGLRSRHGCGKSGQTPVSLYNVFWDVLFWILSDADFEFDELDSVETSATQYCSVKCPGDALFGVGWYICKYTLAPLYCYVKY